MKRSIAQHTLLTPFTAIAGTKAVLAERIEDAYGIVHELGGGDDISQVRSNQAEGEAQALVRAGDGTRPAEESTSGLR